MICPTDNTQMTQYRQIGGGESSDDTYETWEVKSCPTCSRLIKETYTCQRINEQEARKLEAQMGVIYSGEEAGEEIIK